MIYRHSGSRQQEYKFEDRHHTPQVHDVDVDERYATHGGQMSADGYRNVSPPSHQLRIPHQVVLLD